LVGGRGVGLGRIGVFVGGTGVGLGGIGVSDGGIGVSVGTAVGGSGVGVSCAKAAGLTMRSSTAINNAIRRIKTALEYTAEYILQILYRGGGKRLSRGDEILRNGLLLTVGVLLMNGALSF
jgi:hypothetical protein